MQPILFQNEDKVHEGHGLFYEFHRNQSGSPDNVLLHALGQWRMSRAFHDLCFLPAIAVRKYHWKGGWVWWRRGGDGREERRRDVKKAEEVWQIKQRRCGK